MAESGHSRMENGEITENDPSRGENEEEMAEDDRWAVSFRRRLRQQQREIINDVQKRREEITLPDELIRQVSGLDSIFKDVVASREAVIDSEGFRILSAIGREQVDSVQGELIQFDTIVYAEKLVTYMGGRRADIDNPREAQLDWSKLGRRAMRAVRRAPTPTFLDGHHRRDGRVGGASVAESVPCKNEKMEAKSESERQKVEEEGGKEEGTLSGKKCALPAAKHGALDLQPLKKYAKSTRRKKDRDTMTEMSKPKEVTDLEDEEESTTKDVVHVFNCLKRACERDGRIHYLAFLVDPTSFAHTVENMFHFSFLIKDGRAGVEIGEDGQPYIHLPEEVNEVGQSTKPTKNQAIISFDMSNWRRAIEKFNIRESFIPPRDQR